MTRDVGTDIDDCELRQYAKKARIGYDNGQNGKERITFIPVKNNNLEVKTQHFYLKLRKRLDRRERRAMQ